MEPRLINNMSEKVVDDLRKNITPKSKLSIAAASFSLFAFETLKEELEKVDSLRFIFTSPTFVNGENPKESREFDIERFAREQALFGSEFELKLRNQLNQKAIAVECAEWIRKKAKFRTNTTEQNFQTFLHVKQQEDDALYTPFNDFSAVGLGIEKGNNIAYLCNRISAPLSNAFINTFNECWVDSKKFEDVTQKVIDSIATVYKENSPNFIYFVTLYNIFHEFLNDISEDVLPNSATGFKESAIWKKLFNFQKDAALAIINKLEMYNGCILADSVGLGKTFTALGVIKYYEQRNKDVLVLCPKKLNNNWVTYKNNQTNNPVASDRFRYDVLYHSDLSRESGYTNTIDLSRIIWNNYDLVVIDESHNFRNGGAVADALDDDFEDDGLKENRYMRLMNQVIRKGKKTKVLMLSATPVNNRFNDLKNQLQLAYEGDAEKMDSLLKLDNGIESIFRQAQGAYNAWSKFPAEERTTERLLEMLDFDFFELLDCVTIARSRKHIANFYDINDVGKFPTRMMPISESPDLTDLPGVDFDSIYTLLTQLQMSVYSPARFVQPSKMGGYIDSSDEKEMLLGRETGIRKLMSINMLKRLESSVYGFQLTLNRYHELVKSIVKKIDDFEAAQNAGGVTKNSADSKVTYDAQSINEADDEFVVGKDVQFSLADMDYVKWRNELKQDLTVLDRLQELVKGISPEHDLKLQTLFKSICNKIDNPINTDCAGNGNKKVLIFTAFADTAEYLYDQLSGRINSLYGIHTGLVTGQVDGRTTLKLKRSDFNTVLTYFSPISKERALLKNVEPGDIDILIATDCISEGQNLQDCDYLINYDIHWNPVRIIQRFGRIDRIGSKNEKIQLVNFWPNVSLDEYIKLKDRVVARMKISVMTASGDENPISAEEKGDLEYRKEQLRRLKEDVVDLEDMKGGVNIVDLGLNDFRMDLLQYRENHREIEKAPSGIYSIVPSSKDMEPGVIFILRNRNNAVNIRSKNRLHPFYMVYLKDDGSVLCDHLSPKRMLDLMRHACKGVCEPVTDLCDAFNKETADGRKMGKYSDMLQQAIASIIEVKEESDIDSLFGDGETTALSNEIRGLDDFELVTFLVVRKA